MDCEIACRARCKITWLKEGDAPSKYFFARLKAKHAQEEIAALEINGGHSIEDRDGILEEVHRFYENLYAAEVETDCMLENRRKVVGRIDKRLTMEQNHTLEEIPSEELITSIVMEMPKEKSPGIDGVMIEILRLGWEFMREDCFQMVQAFWDKKKLRGKDNKGAGCEIARPGTSFKYLGVVTSSPIDEKAVTEEMVRKLMKKLKHWSNRLLSWPAKTFLLKHVLAATPLYQLMSVGLCRDGLEELERLCRNFLWGWNEDGNPKHALIAWERIAQEKWGGGLGWTSFKNMADALHTRLIGRILEGNSAEWIHLARSFILRTLRKGAYQRESTQWSWQECLILLPLTKIEGSPTLTRILGSWNRTRKQLMWDSRRGELDRRMPMLQIKAIYQVSKGGGVTSVTNGRELGLLRRVNIKNLEEAMDKVSNSLDALKNWIEIDRVVKKLAEQDLIG
ncbi:hypothetical protein R1sor_016716 [Riccia sorocarpa]|uniref:Uncharacterized protein n=1 Tax=Riccia sorocarpa TaxID=122646 RepID=A0ABD3HFV9_9MARC